MAWYDKYMIDDQTELKKREEMFRQHMREMKELDKYERKKERYERLKNRPAKRRRRKTGGRKRRKTGQWIQRSAQGDLDKQQWVGQMGGAQGSRHREYPGPTPAVRVGKSGAPQFASLASMGHKSPGQLGFKGYTGRPNYKYTPRGTSARQDQGEGQAERYYDWNTMQWVTPQEPKKKKGRGPRQAPRAWAERQESLGRPSDYHTYLRDRRLRMSTGLQDPMGSAISAGRQAAGMVGQGIDRLDPHNPDNIFHRAGEWLGGGGVAPPFWAPQQAPPRQPISFPPSPHGIGVGNYYIPGETGPVPPGQRRPYDPIWMG